MSNNQDNGNVAAMREALVKIYQEVRSYCFDYGAGESHESLVDRIVDDPPDYTVFRDSILEIDSIVEAALSAPARNCDVGKDVRTLLEEYIAMRGFTSDNRIRALYELALPVIEWLLEPTEKMKGESRWKRTS